MDESWWLIQPSRTLRRRMAKRKRRASHNSLGEKKRRHTHTHTPWCGDWITRDRSCFFLFLFFSIMNCSIYSPRLSAKEEGPCQIQHGAGASTTVSAVDNITGIMSKLFRRSSTFHFSIFLTATRHWRHCWRHTHTHTHKTGIVLFLFFQKCFCFCFQLPTIAELFFPLPDRQQFFLVSKNDDAIAWSIHLKRPWSLEVMLVL